MNDSVSELSGVDAADDAIIGVDTDDAIVDWDVGAETMFGWSAHEVRGERLIETVIAAENTDDYLAALARHTATSGSRGRCERVELSACRRDGQRIPVELLVVSRGSEAHGLTVIARDRTPLQQAEAARRELAAITRACDDAIVTESLHGTITSWNAAAERIFGWGANEVVGGASTVLAPADRADEAARLTERVRHGESTVRCETRRLRRDGDEVDVALTLVPICGDCGGVTGVTTIARELDVEDGLGRGAPRGTASRESAATDDELHAALEQARRSEERARTFLANAAHQLRRPVTGMQACAEALLTGPPQHKREWLLASMVRETARAGRLIADLLRMARLDQGEPLQPEPCDVVGVCTDEMDRLYSLAPHLDLVIRAEPIEEGWPTLDTHAIREILSNLLDNGRRYAVSQIQVGITVQAGRVEIRIADDGPGMDAETAERAFDRFMTLDEEGGSGLGLPVARGLARAHGGDLTYEDGAFLLRVPFDTDQGATS